MTNYEWQTQTVWEKARNVLDTSYERRQSRCHRRTLNIITMYLSEGIPVGKVHACQLKISCLRPAALVFYLPKEQETQPTIHSCQDCKSELNNLIGWKGKQEIPCTHNQQAMQ